MFFSFSSAATLVVEVWLFSVFEWRYLDLVDRRSGWRLVDSDCWTTRYQGLVFIPNTPLLKKKKNPVLYNLGKEEKEKYRFFSPC